MVDQEGEKLVSDQQVRRARSARRGFQEERRIIEKAEDCVEDTVVSVHTPSQKLSVLGG